MHDAAALEALMHDPALEALDAALATGDLSLTPPPTRPELKNLSHMHEAIMNWMLVNPARPLRECAAFFGVTQAWLSCIIHSGCFQARLKEKQDAIFNTAALDITTKLGALADVGVEKLQEQLETSENPKFIKEVTEMALTKLGFGTPRPAAGAVSGQNVQQNNFYVASQADLVAARKMLTQEPSSPAPAVPVEAANNEPASDVPRQIEG